MERALTHFATLPALAGLLYLGSPCVSGVLSIQSPKCKQRKPARGWAVMASKSTAGGKLLLFGPVQLCVTYINIYMCFPKLGSSYVPEPWLCAGMRETHQSGRQCSILRSGKQQDVTSSSVCATGQADLQEHVHPI